ncbi:MAG TPA: serine hydrolase [Bryobacteraceae bacterium]|nr:serine hydrolase [Bryobacteraceae bacterium]
MLFRGTLAMGALVLGLSSGFAADAVNEASVEPDRNLVRDPGLERSLEGVIDGLQLDRFIKGKHLAVSLVDITDIQHPRYSGLNDREMMYAASLPKICALVAGFELIQHGKLRYTQAVKDMFTRMVRYSSNTDASRAIHTVGFDYISEVLTSAKYRLYDPAQNGGLWLGKAYGGLNDRWKPDPLHHLSHGATTLQVARFFLMLQEGRLVSPEYSAEMKEILSKPGINHKFVKGLQGRDCEIYRKSGTWQTYHADGALVEHGGKTYIAVALMEDARGAEIFPQLIQKLDDVITRN